MSGAKLIIIAALISLAIGACATPDGPTVKVDDKTLLTHPAATIRRGRVYVPITAFRKIGLYVKWKPGENSGTVAWPESDLIYDVTAGRSWVPGQIAGSRYDIPGTPYMSGDQLLVPLRAPVSDTPSARNFWIIWDSRNHTAKVYRAQRWLRWRLKMDADLKAALPGCYETPM